MGVRGVETALRIGHDRPYALRFGMLRWRKVKHWGHICPNCGATVSDAEARAKHESWDARLLLLMRWADVVGEDTVRLLPAQHPGRGSASPIEHMPELTELEPG